MSREIYEMIPAKYRRNGRSARRVLWITTSNDGRERVLTETRFQLNIKGHTVAADFVIIENCHTGIILGMETLADMRCVIECQTGTAVLFDDSKVGSLRDVQVKAASWARVGVRVGQRWNGKDILFEPAPALGVRLVRAQPGLYSVRQGAVDVNVFNAGAETAVIKRDSEMGTVSGYRPAGVGDINEWQNTPDDGGLGKFIWQNEEPFKFDLGGSALNARERRSLMRLLEGNRDVFATKYSEMVECKVAEQDIELEPGAKPYRTAPRRMHPKVKLAVDKVLKELWEAGIITRSVSCWGAALVPVMKKDSSVRICVDYRELNKSVKFDSHPLTTADSIFQGIAEAKPTIFSKVDCYSGYFGIRLTERAKEYSTFVTPDACYKFNRLPQGLRTSGAGYSRAMETMLRGLPGVYFYLDDVIITARDPVEHEVRLQQVFDRFREGGMRLKPSKCEFAGSEVTFLGFTVSQDGLTTTEELVKKIRDFPVPRNVKDVRAWLGLSGFYRRFVDGYPSITQPLTGLLRKGVAFEWGERQQESFEKLRKCLITAPVLAHPNYEKPWIIRADASGYAIGAVLSQEHDGQERPVAYWGRKLSDAETRYHITELEALAVVAALKKFEPIVRHQEIVVYTDHSPLVQLLGTSRLSPSPRIQRWGLYVSTYKIKIMYRPGKTQQVPDALSRREYISHSDESPDWSELPPVGNEVFGKQRVAVATRNSPQGFRGKGKTSIADREQVPGDNQEEGSSEVEAKSSDIQADIDSYPQNLSTEALRINQEKDAFCKEMRDFLTTKRVPDDDQKARKLTLMADYFGIAGGVLVRYPPVSRKSREEMIQVKRCMVVPASMVGDLLYCLHDTKRAGHIGRDALMTRIVGRYWWPGMMADVYSYVNSCQICQKRKVDTHRARPPLQSYGTPRGFLDTVATDVAGPLCPSGPGGKRFIVIFCCAYSGMVFAFPVVRHTAEVIATLLVKEICLKYGVVPRRLHSDRGTDYSSRIIRAVCNLLGCNKTFSVPYLPRSNGLAERNVGLIKDRLSSILGGKPAKWADYVSWAAFTVNVTPSPAIGNMSPFCAAFGREPMFPLDGAIKEYEDEPKHVRDYVGDLIEKLDYADQVIRASRSRAQGRRKDRYDRNATVPGFKPGDLVWKLVKVPGQADKLRFRYAGPYQLMSTRDGVRFKYRSVRDGQVGDTLLHVSFAKKANVGVKRPKPSRELVKEVSGRTEGVDVEATRMDCESWEFDEEGNRTFPNLSAGVSRRNRRDSESGE